MASVGVLSVNIRWLVLVYSVERVKWLVLVY